MDFYKSFKKNGRKKQLWKDWEQTWQRTSCLTTLIKKSHFLSSTMPLQKVSPVTFIPIVSTKISIYEGNRWTVPQNFLRLLPYHTMYHLIFHSQQFWWFRILMLISGTTKLLKGNFFPTPLHFKFLGPKKLQQVPKTSLGCWFFFNLLSSYKKILL